METMDVNKSLIRRWFEEVWNQKRKATIHELISPGASLILSDQGLGPETGKGTDFIVLTR